MKRLSIPNSIAPQCLEVPDGVARSCRGSLHVRPGQTMVLTDGEAAIVLAVAPTSRVRDVREESKINVGVDLAVKQESTMRLDPPKIDEVPHVAGSDPGKLRKVKKESMP